MSSTLQLSVRAESMSDEEVAVITRELSQWINENAAGCRAAAVTAGPAPEGAKGFDLAILGMLSLEILKTGVLGDLINCLSTYVTQRRRTVSLTLKNNQGKEVEIKAENLGSRELADLLRQVSELAEPKSPHE